MLGNQQAEFEYKVRCFLSSWHAHQWLWCIIVYLMTRYRHSYWLGEVLWRLAKRRVSADWFRWSQLDSVRILFDYHHDGDVIVDAMASQITSRTIVYSTVYPSAAQRKHQSSASLAFVRGIHRRFHEVLFIIHQLNDLAPLSDKLLPNQKYVPFCPQCPWAMGGCFNIKARLYCAGLVWCKLKQVLRAHSTIPMLLWISTRLVCG